MSSIRLQDLTAIIHNTSRYGVTYDTVHVETLLVTDETISTEQSWFVPAGVSVPNEVLEFFKATNMPMYPMHESKILEGTQDIQQQAEAGNLSDVMNDAARFMLRAVMKKTPLTPIVGTSNIYMLSYDYKLYPLKDAPNNYEFKVVLPFDGLVLNPQGGRVQVTVMTPINAQIDQTNTYGKDINGQEIGELIREVEYTQRKIVAFQYQLDPVFTIRYFY